MRIISSQSFFLYAARPTVISTVDSGAEKAPVSMAPVPPLPLSFRPERSKAEWSGEISGPNGTGPIAVGDLGAQSNNRFQTPLSPYRHAAPLEMTYGAGSSTVMEKGNNDTIPCSTVISTGTEQSGVEWRNLRPQWHSPIAVGDLGAQSINGVQMPLSSYRHAAPLEMTCWRAAHSHGEQKQMTQIPHPPTCHFDRNGAKRSGVEKSPAPTAQAPLR